MRYTATKYRPLARKHGLDAWAVASAAFEVMLAPSTRNAGNPWAVVTRAVQITWQTWCGTPWRQGAVPQRSQAWNGNGWTWHATTPGSTKPRMARRGEFR